MIPFKVTYKDRFGEEETIGYTDGSDLHVTLRNQLFTGSSFNMLEAVPPFLHNDFQPIRPADWCYKSW